MKKTNRRSAAKIKTTTSIAEIVGKWPKAADVLMADYGFHCIGCFASGMESLEEGARVHGMEKAEIKAMVEELNKLV